jgi:predicted RND superfamily exporter protein
MGFASRGITLVAVVMPVILVTYCVADTIHITERFRRLYAAGGSVRAALQRTMGEVVRPVVLTSLTTAAGFLAFTASSIPPLRELGIFSALGLLGALIISLLVVPPVMLLAGRRSPPARRHRPVVTGRLGAAMVAVAGRSWAVVLVGLALTAVLGLGWSRVRIQDSWLDNFSAGSALVRTDRWFNERFLGSNVLNVVLEAPHGSTALEAGFLEDVRRLQRHIDREEAVGGSISLADQMATVGLALTGEAVLPRSAAEADEWALLLEVAGGSGVLAPYLDQDETSTCVWVYLNRADTRKTRAVMEAVGELAPRASFAGDAFLGLHLVELVARGQWLGVLLAVGLSFVVVLLFLPNLRDALLVVLPVGLAVLWNYGWMGWSGLPLGVATSTFSAISLGIGIDFAIHWHETLKLRLRDAESWEDALAATGATSGGAILLNAVVLLCGLGVLFASAVPPNRRLAILVSVNLLACLVATLVLLPALATLLRRWRAPVNPAEAWTRNEPGALS